jgi:hypothetical protein
MVTFLVVQEQGYYRSTCASELWFCRKVASHSDQGNASVLEPITSICDVAWRPYLIVRTWIRRVPQIVSHALERQSSACDVCGYSNDQLFPYTGDMLQCLAIKNCSEGTAKER